MAQMSRKSPPETPLGPLFGVAAAVALLVGLLPAAPTPLEAQDTTPCVPSDTSACLLDSRFEVSVVFRTVEASGDAHYLPKGTDATSAMLDFYILDKGLYELRYELNNRPDWVAIPLEGVRRLLETEFLHPALAGTR